MNTIIDSDHSSSTTKLTRILINIQWAIVILRLLSNAIGIVQNIWVTQSPLFPQELFWKLSKVLFISLSYFLFVAIFTFITVMRWRKQSTTYLLVLIMCTLAFDYLIMEFLWPYFL